jgi:PAS domain S-box-containing protein
LRTPWWVQSGLGLLTGGISVGLTLLLRLPDQPFLIPTVGVLVAALRGGFRSGALSGVISLLLTLYFVLPPIRSPRLPLARDFYELGAFAVTALIISLLAGWRREAQLTLEATLSSIADGVIVTDPQGRIEFLNRVAEDLTGWQAKDALGQPLEAVFNIADERTRQSLENSARRAIRAGTVMALPTDTVLTTRNGRATPVAHSAAPTRDDTGLTLGAVVVFRDVSAQRAAEIALQEQAYERQKLLERERQVRNEAEQANRLKDEFLATLSHELRTPLNAVLGWSHMLSRRQLKPEQQQQALAAIHRNALAQARLVDDVLDLSRIVTGRMSLVQENVDVSEIARQTAESFTPAVHAKGQRLTVDVAPSAIVTGDPHRIRQIVWNLLSNATKFTPDGGAISCRVAVAESQVELAVSDTGQGIDPAFLPYVFERFRQGDSSTTRLHGGLGLGLALVHHLVEAHGGTVQAASAGQGQGATITITLPGAGGAAHETHARALLDGA